MFPNIAVLLMSIALGLSPSTLTAQVHPAVARIIVPEGNGASLGSGTLVAVNERYGLVVTNWHVVRDGNGHVIVAFADGFHSGATVVKADRDWDLAALVIWRPRVCAVPLASAVPRPGELLTIAGYGKGRFRMASGRCTQYVSPGGSLPFEMLELSAQARQGDSGGPILNRQGQLAGVLFGASWGRTAGSHCGRVRKFLAPIIDDFNNVPDGRTMIAAGNPAAETRVARRLMTPALSMNLARGENPANPPGTGAFAAAHGSPATSESIDQHAAAAEAAGSVAATTRPLRPASPQPGPPQPEPPQPGTSRPVRLWPEARQTAESQPGRRFQHPLSSFSAQTSQASLSSAATPGRGLPTAAIAERTASPQHMQATPPLQATRRCNSSAAPLAAGNADLAAGGRAAAASETQMPERLRWEDIAGETWPSRIKTLLAMVGMLAIFIQVVRLLGP